MGRKYNIIYFGLLLILFNCNQQVNKENDTVTFTVGPENFRERERIYFSHLFDSIKYIILDNSDDCLIGNIDKILFHDHIFYVLDRKQHTLLVFSETGQFLWKINKRGNGPGEYRSLQDFDINQNKLYLFDPRSKVLEYDLNGMFVKSYSEKTYGNSILVDNERFYISTCNNTSKFGDYSLLIMDDYGKTFKNGIPITQKNLINACVTFQQSLNFCRYKDTIRFYTPLVAKVFSIVEDDISVQYNFDFKHKKIPENYFNENTYEDLKESSYAYGLNSYWENDSFFSFNMYAINENGWDILYSKKDNKLTCGGLYDDIAYCFPVIQVANNDFLIGFRTMDQLHREYEYAPEKRKNTIVEKIVKNTDEEDNPVIFICYFKQ